MIPRLSSAVAPVTEKFRLLFKVKKTRFCNFTMLQKQQKKCLLKTEHSELNSCMNMVAKLGIDALKIYEQMRLKIGKNLRTASLNLKFSGSYKKKSLMGYR